MTILQTVPYKVASALLLLSRETLDREDKDHARALLNELSDGSQLVDLATQKFSLPFVARHLNELAPPWHNPDKLRDRVQAMTFSTLRVSGAQINFHNKCIRPANVRQAYIKGLAVGAQYYDNPSLRFARDVDVIVDQHQMLNVIQRAQEHGYVLIDDGRSKQVLTDTRDIDAALRYERVANLVSPEGIMIEVHEEIDKDQGIFFEPRMLFEAVPIKVQSVEMHTLPHAQHFIFVAYHASRHGWSSLHWLADLDAMSNHASFDEERVLELAEVMGLRPMIEATLKFIEMTKRLPENLGETDKIHQMLCLCVLNLEGGLEVEAELRSKHTRYALPFAWLVSPKLKRRILWKRFLGRFRPTYKSYAALPLPHQFSWVYILTSPLLKLLAKLSR